MAFSPRLPLSVFLPLALFAFWWTTGAFPVPLLVATLEAQSALGCVVQGALAGLAFLRVRRLTGGRWLFGEGELAGPGPSLGRALVFAAVGVLVAVPLLAVQLVVSVLAGVERETRGFIEFSGRGVSLTERVYSRDDSDVVLVGMMHIGEDEAYRALFESFAVESTVLLQEGVTDRTERLEIWLDYAPLARTLGLEVQIDPHEVKAEGGEGDVVESWPHIRHADVDLAEFSDESIAFLEVTGAVFSSDDTRAAIAGFQEFLEGAEPDTWARIEEDVLHSRNRQLIEALDGALPDYRRVVVPWGALHLPELEDAVVARGFEQVESRRHELLSWASVLAALMDALRAEPTGSAPNPP